METEDYVTYKVAKLLKEKGYNCPCKHYYRHDSKNIFESNWFLYNNINYDIVECTAPKLEDVSKWLREKHNLYVNVYIYNFKWTVDINRNMDCNINSLEAISYGGCGYFDSYEEALSEGIKEALKLI